MSETEEMSMRELILSIQNWLQYLCSKWRVFLIVGFVGAGVGLLYAFLQKPLYTATTTFVLESGNSNNNLSQYAGMAAVLGVDLNSGTSGLFHGDNIMELYKSREMLSKTLLSKVYPDSNKLLVEWYIDFNELRETWVDNPDLLNLDFTRESSELSPMQLRARDSLLTKFVNTINESILQVDKPDKKLSIIRVMVKSSDEVFSKAFNEALVKQVNEFYIHTKTKKSADNIRILEEKVDSVRRVMTGAIYSAAKVSDATPNLNPTRQVQRIVPAQEAQFSAEANKVMLSQLLQNLELTKMQLLQEQPLIQLVDKPVYPLKLDRASKAKGVVFGGISLGLVALLVLVLMKCYHNVMDKDQDVESRTASNIF